MTAHPIDTEALRAEIEGAVTDYRKVFPAPWKLSPNLDLAVRAAHALAAAEHRADEAETGRDEWRQTAVDERAAALDQIEAVKDRDARIKAVKDVLHEWRYVTHTRSISADLWRALDGDTP